MADILWPMQIADTEDPLLYAERDPIGVEAFGDDERGFNELADWTEREYDAAAVEHNTSTTFHDTSKIPRGVLHLRYDGTNYDVLPESYFDGSRGSGVAAASQTATGEIEITLGTPMSSTNFRLLSGGINEARKYRYVVVRRYTISSTTVFRVRRWSADEPTSAALALTDGDCTIMLVE